MCSFCSEFENDFEGSYYLSKISVHSKIKNRVLIESDNWVVIPTIGPISEGHLLITTKEHYSCLRNTPIKLLEELYVLLDKVECVYKKMYGTQLIAFEHGNGDLKIGGACIEHTHIHVLPCNDDVYLDIMNYDFIIDEVNSMYDVYKDKYKAGYLLYKSPENREYLITGEVIPSQFFRQIFSKKIGVQSEWDWRSNHNINMLVNTYNKIKEYTSA